MRLHLFKMYFKIGIICQFSLNIARKNQSDRASRSSNLVPNWVLFTFCISKPLSILFLIASGQPDKVFGQAEIWHSAFFVEIVQPCTREPLVTVSVPVHAAVVGRMRREVGDCVERGIGVFAKLLHIPVTGVSQMAGQ